MERTVKCGHFTVEVIMLEDYKVRSDALSNLDINTAYEIKDYLFDFIIPQTKLKEIYWSRGTLMSFQAYIVNKKTNERLGVLKLAKFDKDDSLIFKLKIPELTEKYGYRVVSLHVTQTGGAHPMSNIEYTWYSFIKEAMYIYWKKQHRAIAISLGVANPFREDKHKKEIS